LKKGIAIFLLGLLIASKTEFHQILKLPVLVQHFMEHKERDPETTLLAFLTEHYAAIDVVDEDYDRDMQLPFKSPEFTLLSVIPFIPQTGFVVEKEITAFSPTPVYLITNDTLLPETTVGTIWQPPRA